MVTIIPLPAIRPIRLSRFLPHVPTAPQAYFIGLREREAMYGSAAGGCMSDALLMDSSQFVDVPGYAALILRRSYKDLALPGAIMDRALSWWRPFSQIKWVAGEKTFSFPSGATIAFGYLTNRERPPPLSEIGVPVHRLRRADPVRRGRLPAPALGLRRTAELEVPLRQRRAP